MAKKFNEVINEFLRIYGGETEFIRALREKNEELDSKKASDAEAEAALQELMTSQFRRINRNSLSSKRNDGGAEASSASSVYSPSYAIDTSASTASAKSTESVQAPLVAKPEFTARVKSSVISQAQDLLKNHFDNALQKVRYTRRCDSEDRIVFSCSYILDNTIKLPVEIILDRPGEIATCTIIATLPMAVQNSLLYPICKKISEINSKNDEPVGAFYIGSDTESEDSDVNTVFFKYTFIIDTGLVIADFEKYFNSACRSVLKHYDDILLCARGHFKSSETREIMGNIEALQSILAGQTK